MIFVEGCRVEGSIKFEGLDIFTEIDSLLLRYRVGMVFQQPSPFPKSIYDNVAYGPRVQGITSQSVLDGPSWRSSLKQAAIWDELKDRLNTSALGLSRRAAAAPVHCKDTCRAAFRDPYG